MIKKCSVVTYFYITTLMLTTQKESSFFCPQEKCGAPQKLLRVLTSAAMGEKQAHIREKGGQLPAQEGHPVGLPSRFSSRLAGRLASPPASTSTARNFGSLILKFEEAIEVKRKVRRMPMSKASNMTTTTTTTTTRRLYYANGSVGPQW
jgi:hypothetical protein